MAKKRVEIVTHTFKGPRFEDHGLDVDVLEELINYKNLLVETAKELWRRNHPDSQRLPRNYEKSLSLKFYEIREECAAVPLKREIEYEEDELQFEPQRDELDEAVDLVAKVTEAANHDAKLPEDFPKNIIPLFENYGKTLREGESFEQKPVKNEKPSVYSKITRERLLKMVEGVYEDIIDLTGEVRLADLDGLNFTLRLEDGTKIDGKFTEEQEENITNALREHASQRLRVKGRAEFTSPDGNLKRIISVEEMMSHQAGEAIYDPNARPIWEIAVEIGASVPDDEWAKLPTDLSKNVDHYLYGAPKEKE